VIRPLRLLIAAAAVAAVLPATAQQLELQRWTLQDPTRGLTPGEDEIGHIIIRRANRDMYARNHDAQLLREDERVTATVALIRPPEGGEAVRRLVELRLGPIVFTDSLEALLGPQLLAQTLARDYVWIDEGIVDPGAAHVRVGPGSVEDVLSLKQVKDAFWWTSADFSVALPCVYARLTDRLMMFEEIGHEELGYPLLSAGTFRAGIAESNIKLWFESPLLFLPPSATLFRHRMLDGGFGAGVAFDLPSAGGELGWSDLTQRNGLLFIDPSNVVSIGAYAQAYYVLAFRVARFLPGPLRIKLGGGYHQINRGRLSGDAIIKRDRGTLRGGPIVRAEYASDPGETRSTPTVEAMVQYYGTTLSGSLTWNVLDWLGVQASAVQNVSPDSWDHVFSWYVSPRIRM
jgi:hypothetical protein